MDGADGLQLGGTEGGGIGQADCGLGGSSTPEVSASVKDVLSGIFKCFKNTIRVELRSTKEHYRVNHEIMHQSFIERYGIDSKQVTEIKVICKGAEELTWFITYKNQIPENTVSSYKVNVKDPYIKINGVEASLYDASENNNNNRYNYNYNVMNDKSRDIETSFNFRIHGLPTDVGRSDVFKVMGDLGLKDVKEEGFRQVYLKNTGMPGIRTDMVDFKICYVDEGEESSAREQTKLIGEHKVIIGEYSYPIKITCFGFCNVCKEEGHNAGKCEVRIKQREERLLNTKCNLCKVTGHYKSQCPNKARVLKEKEENTRCFNCRKLGHYKSDCTSAGPEWESNKLVSNAEMLEFVKGQMFIANNPDIVDDSGKLLNKFNYTVKNKPLTSELVNENNQHINTDQNELLLNKNTEESSVLNNNNTELLTESNNNNKNNHVTVISVPHIDINKTVNLSSPNKNENITIASITGHQIAKIDSIGIKRNSDETSISQDLNDNKKLCDGKSEGDTLDDSSLSMNMSKDSI